MWYIVSTSGKEIMVNMDHVYKAVYVAEEGHVLLLFVTGGSLVCPGTPAEVFAEENKLIFERTLTSGW